MSRKKDKHRLKNQGMRVIVTPGVCRVCGCTEEDACIVGGVPCAWADKKRTLCTACI